MRWVVIGAAALLAGCAHDGQKVEPQIVKVPVPVPCVDPSFPKEPTYPDTIEAIRAAPTHDAFDRLMQAGWVLRTARATAVEAEIERCRKVP